MTILVTGVAGFIGSNFVYYYLRRHPERKIIGLDNLTYAGNLDNLSGLTEEEKKRFTFIKGDICDTELVDRIFSENEIDGVINFAAESHVDRSIHDPQIFLKTNILGTQVLLDVARKHWKSENGWKCIDVHRDESEKSRSNPANLQSCKTAKFLQISTNRSKSISIFSIQVSALFLCFLSISCYIPALREFRTIMIDFYLVIYYIERKEIGNQQNQR